MSEYEALARDYDRLTSDVPYKKVCAYLRRLFRIKSKSPKTVLDLACGTGSLSILLAQQGYEVLGADRSEDMLAVACEKAMHVQENPPYFIHQSMQSLRLPAPVDAVVCCLDSLNYLTRPEDGQKTIRRVYEALAPGGIFIFDINTPEKLAGLDGQVFLDEDEDVYCVWRAEFDAKRKICRYGMDLFQRRGSLWERSFEEHREYAYTKEQLLAFLHESGFSDVSVYGDRSVQPPEPGAQRIYFAACKE